MPWRIYVIINERFFSLGDFMSRFTYEATDRNETLETYEWDNTWIDHADNRELPRALYIGDSISCGVRTVATDKSGWKILFDGFGTSKSLDNPFFKDAVRLFARQEGKREAVLFNNGLHGWHLSDETEYKQLYEELIMFLLKEFENTPLFVVLTTHIADCEREQRVIARNNAAKEIAEKYNLPIINLYKVSAEHPEFLAEDGVHFTSEGLEMLATEIAAKVKAVISLDNK